MYARRLTLTLLAFAFGGAFLVAQSSTYQLAVQARDACAGVRLSNTSANRARLVDCKSLTQSLVDSLASTPTPPPTSDTTPPTAPSAVTISNLTSTAMTVSWPAATDNVGVSGYRLYRNGVLATTTGALSWPFTALTCETSYVVAVEATDAAGNVSSRASATGVTGACTAAAPTPSTAVYAQNFNSCPDWNQTTWVDPCSSNDGVGLWGGWRTSSGKADEIIAAANDPSDGTGKGFRHWRGAGQNNNGGGISIAFPAQSELSISWTMRYSAGFKWIGGAPGYTKDLYQDQQPAIIVGFSNGRFYVHDTNGSQAFRVASGSPGTWNAINGGTLGDGRFHRYDVLLRLGNNGTVKLFVDCVQMPINQQDPVTGADGPAVMEVMGINWGIASMSGFALGENQYNVDGGDYYTDYDKLVIGSSAAAPIGCPAQ